MAIPEPTHFEFPDLHRNDYTRHVREQERQDIRQEISEHRRLAEALEAEANVYTMLLRRRRGHGAG
jgi:hypothetical protein